MADHTEKLCQKARELALQHTLAKARKRAKYIHERFDADVESIRAFVGSLQDRSAGFTQPAEEWLLDNAEFIEEQALEVKEQLADRSFAYLPRLKDSGGLRIQALCEDYLERVDGVLLEESFVAYMNAYQEVSALTLAEAWFLPLVLRVALVGRFSETMASVRERRDVCLEVERLLSRLEPSGLTQEAIDAELEAAGQTAPLSGPWIVHLIRQLREWADDSASVREWLACKFANGSEDLDRIVAYEHQLQAAYQIKAGNAITSLRANERWDWDGVFERISLLDRALRQEASGIYPQLDARSRHEMLQRIEELARRMRVSESLIAEQAVALAKGEQERLIPFSGNMTAAGTNEEASGAKTAADALNGVEPDDKRTETPPPPRSVYAAYYIFEPAGVRMLMQSLRQCSRARSLPENAFSRRASGTYFASLALLFALVLTASALWIGSGRGVAPAGWAAIALALVFPVSEWVVTWHHFGIERLCRPRLLLRYDFSGGVPAEAATMVVIPAIWSSPEEVEELADRLEIHYLANRDSHIHYALLGDYTDADKESLPEDEALLARASQKIESLNRMYGDSGTTFHFYQRRRQWNGREGAFMGWERKRGKLVEFVELLKGSRETSYDFQLGDRSVLSRIRYIITLDADTRMPMGSAVRMIAALHLPYNRPRLNDARTRVVAGYGVLQPRIGISHESAMKSRLAYFWSDPGSDPYAFAASDPYQDALSQGIFTGKGIFDVDVFAELLCERIPDNAVLSHDLLEGGFMRAALLSDVELIDDHPSAFIAYQKRMHRWVRGDWQLLCWLFSKVCDRRGTLRPVDLSLLTRWQMIDNLRRSLLPPACFAALLLAFAVLPGPPGRWVAVIFATLFLPLIRQLLALRHVSRYPRSLLPAIGQALLAVWTLPFQSAVLLDAVGRTLYRLYISKRRLLEWTSSSHVERQNQGNGQPAMLGASGGYALIVLFALAAALQPQLSARWWGFALALCWALAPLAVRWLDKPAARRKRTLTAAEQEQLHALARQIWAFYEEYAGPEDHYLPPDNVQFEPHNGVAHRTSPTNIGFLLTAALAARDFGFIDTPGLVERLERTVSTVERLDKWNGHLYNWYDTVTLQTLPPAYVSTVDSGNFVASLMAVKQGLTRWLETDFSLSLDGRTGLAAAGVNGRLDVEFAVELEKMKPGGWPEAEGGRGAHNKKTAGFDSPLMRGYELLARLERLIVSTDFRPLYDHKAKLFSLGYNAASGVRDGILYDLLASEARQTSFVAIALGQISVSHWLALGRTVKKQGAHTTLVSWSGTMFEYMMPWLIMRTYRNTLWESTYRGVIRRQIEYARERGVPFGISESGYYAFDYRMNYQYQAFGVPGLGFKRGLERDLVLTPYATIMALPYAVKEGLHDLKRMEELGARGRFGFYEAIDFTASRMPEGEAYKVIRSFMAHHQGMSLLTIANLLLPVKMYDHFHRDKRVQAAEQLLIERIPPRDAILKRELAVKRSMRPAAPSRHAPLREYGSADTSLPEVNVHSNGSFTTVTSNSGSGFIRYEGLSVTRWRADPVADPWGSFVYIRDVTSDQLWSPAFLPCRVPSASQRVQFSQARTTFRREDGSVGTTLDIAVSPESNAEVRRLTLSNGGSEARILEITTFVELSLAPHDADRAHPAFTKLFIETAYAPDDQCLLARKRPRNEGEKAIWAFHSLSAAGGRVLGQAEFETDRTRFIGRGYTMARPQGIEVRLAGTVGSVADPAFVMRRRLSVEPGTSVTLIAVTGVAETKEQSLDTARQLVQAEQAERTFQLAWTRSQIELRHMDLTAADLAVFQMLAGRTLYGAPLREERKAGIAANVKGQHDLWAYGISGDRPIVLARISDTATLSFIAKLLTGHDYLRHNGLHFDLVVLNESAGGYQQDLQEALRRTAEQIAGRREPGQSGVHILPAAPMPDEDKSLLFAVSRVILRADGPSLKAQLKAADRSVAAPNSRLIALELSDAASVAGADAMDRSDAASVAGADAMELSDAAIVAGAGETDRSDAVIVAGADAMDRSDAAIVAGAGAMDRSDAAIVAGADAMDYRDLDRKVDALSADLSASASPERIASDKGGESGGYLFDNGWGGFSPDGREYHIVLKNGNYLPAPWINVMANRGFGCLASELYTGYTWRHNSRECKITPWSNDPSLDPPGEVCYLRDEDSGEYWQMVPERRQMAAVYNVSYGRGYTKYEHVSRGIQHEMTVFVPLDDPVKIIRLRLKNTTPESRRLSVTYYAEWVLGVHREGNASFLITDWDDENGILLARNVYQDTFRTATAFLTVNPQGDTIESAAVPGGIFAENSAAVYGERTWTGDRLEFIGRNGTSENPAAMRRPRLSGAAGAAYDSCGAVQAKFAIEPEAERTVYILLGCDDSRDAAARLAAKYREGGTCEQALDAVKRFWDGVLGTITVSTPSPEMDVMLNNWLLYQTLACRMWARTAFYQAGGAYGFRDQLQDSLAMLHSLPELTRAQILLHASHQYEEGDVQHWWHEETHRGIRTRFSDDLLWLPYAVIRYLEHTGDESLLDETVPFLRSDPLGDGEHERYEPTVLSEQSGTVFEHCLRALDRSLKFGEHGLPLIGIGDWNDGMSHVGPEGRGESVWLGWFLGGILGGFAELCERRGSADLAERYRSERGKLTSALNENGWDGKWYRRAFTDGGQWLGSVHNAECRIDSIAQSWSVISGMAPQDRAMQAMQSFDRELVDRSLSVAHILTPAFDRTDPSPGYIQGYPPGIRENGGQYTHGVIWSIVAWCGLGNGDKAFELFHMLNPIMHARTPAEVRKYFGEPYVMAADIYTEEPHRGHAGWTWYTGASGWMYQAGVEWILGIRRRGSRLHIRPCIPTDWPGFSATYRYAETEYRIAVQNPSRKSGGQASLTIDGQEADPSVLSDAEGPYVELKDDRETHHVVLTL